MSKTKRAWPKKDSIYILFSRVVIVRHISSVVKVLDCQSKGPEFKSAIWIFFICFVLFVCLFMKYIFSVSVFCLFVVVGFIFQKGWECLLFWFRLFVRSFVCFLACLLFLWPFLSCCSKFRWYDERNILV